MSPRPRASRTSAPARGRPLRSMTRPDRRRPPLESWSRNPARPGFDVGHPGGRVIRRGRRDAVATRSEAREAKAPVGRAFHLDEPGPGRVEQAHRHQRHPRALHRTARGIDHGARDRGRAGGTRPGMSGRGTDSPAPRHAATSRYGITRCRKDMSFRAQENRVAAVDGNRHARHEVRGAGREEYRHAGTIVGLAPPGRRRAREDHPVELRPILALAHHRGHIRRDPSRGQRVDLDVVRRELDRHRLRELHDAALRGRVGRHRARRRRWRTCSPC